MVNTFESEHKLYKHFNNKDYSKKIKNEINYYLCKISNKKFDVNLYYPPGIPGYDIIIQITDRDYVVLSIRKPTEFHNFLVFEYINRPFTQLYDQHKNIENIVLNTIRKKKIEDVKQIK